MLTKTLSRTLLLCLVVAFSSIAAQADPVIITSGGGQDVTNGSGSNYSGFSFTFQNGSGSLFTNIQALITGVVGLGQSHPTLNLNYNASGNDVIGTFTNDGITYYSFSTLQFVASAVVTDYVVGQESHVLGAFTFTGTLWGGSTPHAYDTQELIRIGVAGSGIVDATVLAYGGDFFNVRHLTYTFQAPAATPEPASIVLLLGGLTALILRRRFFTR